MWEMKCCIASCTMTGTSLASFQSIIKSSFTKTMGINFPLPRAFCLVPLHAATVFCHPQFFCLYLPVPTQSEEFQPYRLHNQVEIPFMIRPSVGWEYGMHVGKSIKHQDVANLIPALNRFFLPGQNVRRKCLQCVTVGVRWLWDTFPTSWPQPGPLRASPPYTGTVREFPFKSDAGVVRAIDVFPFRWRRVKPVLRRPALMYIRTLHTDP